MISEQLLYELPPDYHLRFPHVADFLCTLSQPRKSQLMAVIAAADLASTAYNDVPLHILNEMTSTILAAVSGFNLDVARELHTLHAKFVQLQILDAVSTQGETVQ